MWSARWRVVDEVYGVFRSVSGGGLDRVWIVDRL